MVRRVRRFVVRLWLVADVAHGLAALGNGELVDGVRVIVVDPARH